jgi:hypothetical protein
METKEYGALRGLIEASVEFPLAVQNWMFGMNSDNRDVEQAALKVFQAWTTFGNQNFERVFESERFAGLMVGAVRNWVQLQRVARDFIESLAPAASNGKAGKPVAELEELRASVVRLRQEVRGITARLNVAKEPVAGSVNSNGARAIVVPVARDVPIEHGH